VHIVRADGRSLAPLVPFRLGVISNSTSHFIVPALVGTAARHGIALECIEANFDQVIQDALSPDSEINRCQPDAVLIALDYHGLPLSPTPGDAASAAASVATCLQYFENIRTGLHQNSKALCIFNTVPRPLDNQFGSLDFALPGTMRGLIEAVNRGLADQLSGGPDLLFDVAGLAETVGLANWHDPTLWNMAKVPFSSDFLPLYADHACRMISAIRGKSRRCLILDLDNTLWSGVIGDDGLDGINIGQGDPTGEAHLDLQRTVLSFRNRGIVLAVSSKNNDEVARLPFREHPEMLLKEDHLAVFQANWNDKATNIRAIAEELSLGIDSMVFLDDNPAERGLVRRLLPEVAVPELPADPALYARSLTAGGYFEAVVFSDEDRGRADFYQDNARRVALQKKAGDIESYLESLNMVITFKAFDEISRGRITQLINKSNQFNLTTRRYTEAEVEKAQSDPRCFTLQVRLVDIFGDNGMISVIVAYHKENYLVIDTWLMSCRVLGRRVEEAVLEELLRHARQLGISHIRGTYHPTARNSLVEKHYEKLGFSLVNTTADQSTVWELDVENAPIRTLPMQVCHSELLAPVDQ
jgi:FkbH-like protein